MNFDPKYLNTCVIGLIVGAGLAVMPYTGLVAPASRPAATPPTDGQAASETAAAPAAKQSWLSRLGSFGKETLCLELHNNNKQDSVTDAFAQAMQRKFPDGKVFKDYDDKPCEPNAFAGIVTRPFDMARSEYDWFDDDIDSYHTQGHLGSVAIFLPGVSKSPNVTVAVDKDADAVMASLVDLTASRITGNKLDADAEDYAVPDEDSKTCISVIAPNDTARFSYSETLARTAQTWYIRDHVERHECAPDYYLAFNGIAVDGSFGRAGYVTAIAARKADVTAPALWISWGINQTQAENKAIGALVDALKK